MFQINCFKLFQLRSNLGFLSMLQSELENLSFMYTNAQEYEKITKRVSELYAEHEKELIEVIFPLSSM